LRAGGEPGGWAIGSSLVAATVCGGTMEVNVILPAEGYPISAEAAGILVDDPQPRSS